MVMMKRIYYIVLSAVVLLVVGCEEFQPVFTGKYDTPAQTKVYTDEDFDVEFTPISELWAMYKANKSQPLTITGEMMIKGQVISSDKTGNVYKSIYIQDETGGIEIKMGKYSLYNEYKVGQWVYVNCSDLTVGAYYGMVQLGFKSSDPEYDTSYLEHFILIDQYVLKGEMASEAERITPKVLAASELRNEENLATLVTIKNLSYDNHIFLIGYINPNLVKDKKEGYNRFFLDEEDPDNWGVTSWALSEQKFEWHVKEGHFDGAIMGDNSTPFTTYKDNVIPTPYTMNQFFSVDGQIVQVRSSGYATFADVDIPQPVLDGEATLTLTGILTKYVSSSGTDIQFTLNDLDGVTKADGSPWYDENGKVIE